MKKTSLILSILLLFAGCDYFSQEETLCVIMKDEIITLTLRTKEDKRVYGKNAMDCSVARSIVKTRTELNQQLKEIKEREKELTLLQNRISYTTAALNRAERERNKKAEEQERRDKNRRQGEALMRLGESLLKGSSSKEKSSSCMYNPATQAMQTCIHVTATGKCAHYTTRC